MYLKISPEKGTETYAHIDTKEQRREQLQLLAWIPCPKAVDPIEQSSIRKLLCFHSCGMVLPEEAGSMENPLIRDVRG